MHRRFRHAFHGLGSALQSREILVHVFIAVVVIAVGVVACLDSIRWTLLVFAIGLVLVAETFNTALEAFLDVPGVRDPTVRRAKDLAAAAVLVAAVTAAVVGLLVLGPPFLLGTAAHCLS